MLLLHLPLHPHLRLHLIHAGGGGERAPPLCRTQHFGALVSNDHWSYLTRRDAAAASNTERTRA